VSPPHPDTDEVRDPPCWVTVTACSQPDVRPARRRCRLRTGCTWLPILHTYTETELSPCGVA
jgi:hypothetical protein